MSVIYNGRERAVLFLFCGLLVLFSWQQIIRKSDMLDRPMEEKTVYFGSSRSRVEIKTNFGTIRVDLFDQNCPEQVKNFLFQIRRGIYQKSIFHKLINAETLHFGSYDMDFHPLPESFPVSSIAPIETAHYSYTLGMLLDGKYAHGQKMFINLKNNFHLNNFDYRNAGYVIIGRVVEGIAVLDRIKRLSVRSKKSLPLMTESPVIILSARVLEDNFKRYPHMLEEEKF